MLFTFKRNIFCHVPDVAFLQNHIRATPPHRILLIGILAHLFSKLFFVFFCGIVLSCLQAFLCSSDWEVHGPTTTLTREHSRPPCIDDSIFLAKNTASSLSKTPLFQLLLPDWLTRTISWLVEISVGNFCLFLKFLFLEERACRSRLLLLYCSFSKHSRRRTKPFQFPMFFQVQLLISASAEVVWLLVVFREHFISALRRDQLEAESWSIRSITGLPLW